MLAGSALALLAAVLYGISTVVAKKAMDDNDISPLVFTPLSLLFGTVLVFILAGRDVGPSLRVSRRYFGFLIGAGIASGMAVTLLILAVSRAPVAVVTPIAALNPIVALLLAHLFLQRLERVTIRVVAGTTLAVVGVVLVILGSTQL